MSYDILNLKKDYSNIVNTLDLMTTSLNLEFYPEDFIEDANYDEFVQTEYFLNWSKQWQRSSSNRKSEL